MPSLQHRNDVQVVDPLRVVRQLLHSHTIAVPEHFEIGLGPSLYTDRRIADDDSTVRRPTERDNRVSHTRNPAPLVGVATIVDVMRELDR